MKISFKNTKTLFLLLVFAAVLIFSRTFNLARTARFIWDESSDLVNIHEIYIDKKITLIGPISEDGSKVFGSLTYYMYLPFAILGNFDPVSTAYAAAFWGIITAGLIIFLTYKINKRLIYILGSIVIIWYPLVQTGRWAWNPNLIPFWITLSIIFYLSQGNKFKFLAGLSAGLAVHHHYLAIFAAGGLVLIAVRESLQTKKWAGSLSIIAGVALALAPFVLFDLTHPPGLFISRILYFNNLGAKASFLQNLVTAVNGTFYYFTQSAVLEFLLIAGLISLLVYDFLSKSRSLPFFLIFAVQIVGAALAFGFNTHYILAGLPFFIAYLVYPRQKSGRAAALSCLIVLFISGLFTFNRQLTVSTWESNIDATKYITKTIENNIQENKLKNNNIAVLDSPDPNTYGRRYRDLMLIDGVNLKDKGEYEISDHLFVVSTSVLESVRHDAAYEIKYFKSGKLIQQWSVPGSSWKIYLLDRSTEKPHPI